MQLVTSQNLNEIRKQAELNSKKAIETSVQGRDIEFNRKVLEMKNINMLILSHKNKKDKLKQRDSGLNHVLCKIPKEKNIIFLIDFSEILNSERIEKAKILGRAIQNIKLIKKYKNSIKLINKQGRDNFDLRAFLQVLGMPTLEAKKAVES